MQTPLPIPSNQRVVYPNCYILIFCHSLQMAVSVQQSGDTSLQLARKARHQIKSRNLQEAKLSQTEANATKHLRDIEYLHERCNLVQEHYLQLERDQTRAIADILSKEKSLLTEKTECETRLHHERQELSQHEMGLHPTAEQLCHAKKKKKKAKKRKKWAKL